MQKLIMFIKRNRLLVAVVLAIIAVLFIVSRGSAGVVNPNKDKSPEFLSAAGTDYALLYRTDELYKTIDANDDNLRKIQNDMLYFARTTRNEFKNTKVLVGFTFDKKTVKNGDATTFTGHYYGLKDKIQVVLTTFKAGVIRLSITNLKDKTNIDEQLGLNGPKNRLVVKLPVEKDYYSVRYSIEDSKVVATFYQGYTAKDVSDVIELFKKEYGDKYSESDFVFNINAIGNFSSAQVLGNLTNPIQQ